jgi:hypothetical protein
MTDIIMSLTGVDLETAEKALAEHETVEDAVCALFVKEDAPGDKYLPTKPKVDDGLTDEQRAMCVRGRWLQGKINDVFSVAHSQIRSPQPQSVPEASPESHPVEVQSSVEIVVPTTE